MKTFLRGAFGLEVISKWEPNCWIKIDCPDTEDYNYLQKTLNVPEYFLSDIADIDERPRVETEDEWTFIILRIPHRQDDSKMPFITVPLGIIFKDNICISICHYQTVMLKDFLTYYERKNLGFTDSVDLIFKLFLSSSVWYLKSLKIINYKYTILFILYSLLLIKLFVKSFHSLRVTTYNKCHINNKNEKHDKRTKWYNANKLFAGRNISRRNK